jgi:hypothetical protein
LPEYLQRRAPNPKADSDKQEHVICQLAYSASPPPYIGIDPQGLATYYSAGDRRAGLTNTDNVTIPNGAAERVWEAAGSADTKMKNSDG